jgi:ADP-heptose:LPS heptosyltransferase
MTCPMQPIVIWFGRVGDMTLLSALLDILHRRYGRACHVIGAGSWAAQLYATHRDVACVSCLHRYTAFMFDAAWWRTVAALRMSRAAPVYVCESDPRKLRRIRRLLSFAGIAAERCLFITEDPLFHMQRHWVDRLVNFGRRTPPAFSAADYPRPSLPPRGAPLLEVSAAARADCASWLAQRGLSHRPLVLVQPGNHRTMRGSKLRLSAADDKAWPLKRWAALLREVHQRMPQATIVLCGAPREALLLKWIAAAVQLPALVAAELPLPRLLALCERAHSMISVDTGPAHAAAALSLPLVVLFGARAQAEWLPRSPSGSPVVGIGGPPDSSRVDAIAPETVSSAWCALAASGRLIREHGGRLQPASSARHSAATADRRKRGSGPTRGRAPRRQLPMRSR